MVDTPYVSWNPKVLLLEQFSDEASSIEEVRMRSVERCERHLESCSRKSFGKEIKYETEYEG